jgi:hypothetical protein
VLDPEDRVLIIGTSSTPYATEKAKDVQAFKDFFSKTSNTGHSTRKVKRKP